jgi:hypothetical protein
MNQLSHLLLRAIRRRRSRVEIALSLAAVSFGILRLVEGGAVLHRPFRGTRGRRYKACGFEARAFGRKRPSHLSFFALNEQPKGRTPQAPRPTDIPAFAGAGSVLRVRVPRRNFSMAHPCASEKRCASCASPPAFAGAGSSGFTVTARRCAEPAPAKAGGAVRGSASMRSRACAALLPPSPIRGWRCRSATSKKLLIRARKLHQVQLPLRKKAIRSIYNSRHPDLPNICNGLNRDL